MTMPLYRGVRYAYSSSATGGLSVASVPAGGYTLVWGDYYVLCVMRYVTSGTPAITPTSSWVEQVQWVDGSIAFGLFTRHWDEGVPTKWSFGLDANGGEAAYLLSVYSYVSGADPVNVVSASGYVVNDTTIRGVGVTTDAANCRLLWFGGLRSTGFSVRGVPSGMTSRSVNAGSNIDLALADLSFAVAGATGNKDITVASATVAKNGILIALNEGAAKIAPTPWSRSTEMGFPKLFVEREIVRPLALTGPVRITTKDRTLVGVVPGTVRMTQVLDGPDRLEALTIPKWFLAKNGVAGSRPDIRALGWCAKFAGHWYTLDRVTDDQEQKVTLSGRSLEASELQRIFSSTTVNPFVRVAKTPTQIMRDLLSGSGEISMDDPGFADREAVHGRTLYEWLYGTVRWWSGAFAWTANAEYGAGLQEEAAMFRYGGWIGTAADKDYYIAPAQLFGAPPGATLTFAFRARVGYWYANTEYALTALEKWANQSATGSAFGVTVYWYASDRTTIVGTENVLDITASLTEDYQDFSVSFARKSDYFRVAFWQHCDAAGWDYADGACAVFVDDCLLSGENMIEPSGWTYYGDMDQRDTDVLHTDPDWIEFGTWTVGASDISTTVYENELAYIITGPSVDIVFNAGAAGSAATIAIDGDTVQANVDVSGDTTVSITGLDESVEHVVTIINTGSAIIRVEKLVLDAANRISVDWTDMPLTDCLDALVQAVGGELAFDTERRYIFHAAAHGEDLRATNVLELRRGANVISLEVDESRGEVCNRLVYLGYGEGDTRLRVTVDAASVNSDGDTSQDVYGVLTGLYENPEVADWYVAFLEARKIVEERCWPALAYRLSVPDDTAAYMVPGDTVRLYWDADPADVIDVSLRVLEITRDNEGSPATVIVGDRISDLPARLAATARLLDRRGRAA